MSKVQTCKTWLRAHEDLFIDLVRIYLGCGLFVKACYFMTHHDLLNEMIGQTNVSWLGGSMMGHYIILAHMFGGIMLALGILTRVAAAVQLPITLGAVFALYLPQYIVPEQRQFVEYAGLVTFLLALFTVFGAGRFSLDYLILGRRREAAMPRASQPAVTM